MSILRPKFITTTFSSKKKKKRDKGESKSFHIEGLQEKKSNDPEGTESDLKELDPKNLEKENDKKEEEAENKDCGKTDLVLQQHKEEFLSAKKSLMLCWL